MKKICFNVVAKNSGTVHCVLANVHLMFLGLHINFISIAFNTSAIVSFCSSIFYHKKVDLFALINLGFILKDSR